MGPKRHHECPYKREVERFGTQRRGGNEQREKREIEDAGWI